MNLWIRSTSKTNLLQARFLTIMEGKTFYKKNEWEYEGYTICNVALNGNYELLGTYKTKERAIEVLDEIQNILKPKYILDTSSIKPDGDFYEENEVIFQNYDANARIEELSSFVYQMPKD